MKLQKHWQRFGATVFKGGVAVTLLTLAPMTVTAQVITNTCTTVPSSAGGVVVGEVVAGQSYIYSASGCITYQVDVGGGPATVHSADPDGNNYTNTCANFTAGPAVGSSGNVCLGLFNVSLVGKINGSSCLQLGQNGSFVAAESGPLTLFINDSSFGDNSGSWNVCISTGNVSAAGQFTECLPTNLVAQHAFNITRDAKYWFTHGSTGVTTGTNEPTCTTLEQAIIANGGTLSLGFACLPAANHTSDNIIDATDAFIETLGFYYKGAGGVGKSKLCKVRRKMAPELIAAIANNVLLGTGPESAGFPADLIEQAAHVAAGPDVVQIATMTATLKKFNSSGLTNNFTAGLLECTANTRKELRAIAKTAITPLNCPGQNETCASAEVVLFSGNQYAGAKFKRKVNTAKLLTGQAYWVVAPPLANAGRSFTVDTAGSNFDTAISILTGTCLSSLVSTNSTNAVPTGLIEVASNDNANGQLQSKLSFTTDGIQSYYILAKGSGGAIGSLKISITSP